MCDTLSVREPLTQSTSYRHVHGCSNAIGQPALVVGADAGLVVCHLLGWRVFLEAGDKVDDVAIVIVELVASAVEAYDEGPRVVLSVFRLSQSPHRVGQPGILEVALGQRTVRIHVW